MRRALSLVLSATLCLATIGCAAIVSNLPIVIAAVTDGIMVLDAIEDFVSKYFLARPNKELEDKIATAMARTRSSLNAALRIAKGAEKLDQAKIDEAFAEFRAAYAELLALLTPLGVTSGPALRATPGGLAVPEPMALTLKAN